MCRPRPSTQHKKEKVKGPRISNLATTGNYQQHNKKKTLCKKNNNNKKIKRNSLKKKKKEERKGKQLMFSVTRSEPELMTHTISPGVSAVPRAS